MLLKVTVLLNTDKSLQNRSRQGEITQMFVCVWGVENCVSAFYFFFNLCDQCLLFGEIIATALRVLSVIKVKGV